MENTKRLSILTLGVSIFISSNVLGQQNTALNCSDATKELKKTKDSKGYRKTFLEEHCPNLKSKDGEGAEKYFSLIQTNAEDLMELEKANVWIAEKTKLDGPLQKLAKFFSEQNNHPKRLDYYHFLLNRMICTDGDFVESAASQIAFYLDRDASGLLKSANEFDKKLTSSVPTAGCLKEALAEFSNPAARSIFHAYKMTYGRYGMPPEQQKAWNNVIKDANLFAAKSSALKLKELIEQYGTKR